MKIDEIKLMYEYNDWADERILACCAKVSPEQYAAPTSIGTGHAGLRKTMVHLLDSLWQTRITLQGYYQYPLADQAAYDATEIHDDTITTFAELRERWTIEKREMRTYIEALTEETLNGMLHYVIPGIKREYVVWQFLVIDLLHAMQHRSEAATLLTFYGQSPGDIDFPIFLSERTTRKS